MFLRISDDTLIFKVLFDSLLFNTVTVQISLLSDIANFPYCSCAALNFMPFPLTTKESICSFNFLDVNVKFALYPD
nr:hypothetical protein [Clostridium botulinum]